MKKFKQTLNVLVFMLLAIFGFSSTLKAQCYETLGSSSNALSTLSNRTNQIIVNNDLNTVLFIHRNDISLFGGDNGNFKYDISTDNGNTWQLNQGNLNPGSTIGVNGGRYPQVGIYNPTGNTNLSSASLVYHGPTVATTFGGYVSGSLLLDGVASSTEHYNQAGVVNTLIPGGFCQSASGKFWTIDEITPDAGFTITGIRILKGVYSAGDVNWTVNTELTPDFNTDIFGGPALADWNMAFDPTGQYGWVVLLTHLNGLPDYNYHPVFYHTVDGGATWSGPVQLDLASFGSISSVEPNPGCGFEVEITVDMNGNPHALIGVFKSAPYYSVYPATMGHLFDFTYNGSSWNAINIAQTSYTQYNTSAGTTNNRFQTSRSDDGTKMVFTWVESDLPSSAGGFTPNLKAVTYDVPTGNISCPVIYSLKCPSALDGQMYQTTVSPNMIEESGVYTVPVVVTLINASGNGLDPAQYYYLNDLSFTTADFATSDNKIAYSPTITVNGSNPICGGGSVGLTANSNSHYLWNTGETTQTITAYGGNYWVVNPDSNFCVGSSNSVNIESIYPPGVYASGSTYLCNGASVDLTVYYSSSGGSILWSTGETTQTITVSTTGTYSAAVDGCTSNAIEVTATTNAYRPSITVDGSGIVCYPGTVLLTANANSSYLWNTGETTQSINASYSGSFWVVNPDSNQCVDNSNSVFIQVNYPPDIYAFGPTDICSGSSVDLYAYYYSAGNSILWSNGATTQIITVSTAGSYSVTVDGCPSWYVVNVNVTSPPTNDNRCNAQSLTVGTLTPFNNTCATVEAGEPVPPDANYMPGSQDGWFDDYFNGNGPDVDNSVWFSFIAPNSGAVNISSTFDNYPYDTQLALYSSSNYSCTGTFTLIAANDDISATDYSSFIHRAYCLQKGKRYFVQVDGFAGTQGSGTIFITSVPNTVTICHKVLNKKSNTLTVSGCALAAHLAHGDQIGACPARISTTDEEDITALSLFVYPNPVNDMMNVSFVSDKEEKYVMNIVDITGRVILSEEKLAIEGENEKTIDLQNISPGIYFLVLNKGENNMQTRIVKE